MRIVIYCGDELLEIATGNKVAFAMTTGVYCGAVLLEIAGPTLVGLAMTATPNISSLAQF